MTATAGYTLTQGIVRATNANALGDSTTPTTLNGGTITSNDTTAYTFAPLSLALSGNVTFGATTTYTGVLSFGTAVNVTGTSIITTNVDLTLTGGLTGSSSLTKSGSAALYLPTASTGFAGNFTASDGITYANAATALGADTSSGTVANGATLSAGAALNYSTRNFTITGTGVSTAGALIINHAGTVKVGTSVTLGATNTYIRGTASGTLSSAIATSGFTLQTGAASGVTMTLSAAISGGGALVFGNYASDTGTVRLTAANTSGDSTITQGVVQAGHINALGTTGTVTLDTSGTLQTLTTGGQNGKLTVASLNNAAGGTIRIGG